MVFDDGDLSVVLLDARLLSMLELLSTRSLSMQGIVVGEGIEKVWVVGFVHIEGSTIDVQLQGSAETTRGTLIPRKKKLRKPCHTRS